MVTANETTQPDAVPSNVTEKSKLPFYRNFLTFPAILKTVCLIFEFSGFICALCDNEYSGSVKFFYIIMILIAFISTVLWFIWYFIQRNRESPLIFLLKVEMYYHATGSLILLLAAVLILNRNKVLLAASILGFITAVGYVIETLFNYWKLKRISQGNGENELLQS